jgi:hypothetical protein
MIENERYAFRWTPCERAPEKTKLVPVSGSDHYIHAETGRLFLPYGRNEENFFIGRLYTMTEIEVDDSAEASDATHGKPVTGIVPVEEWAWSKEGKGAWSRSRCYVCGFGSLSADHSACGKSMDAAKTAGTFP